jgi:radical SAM superfamily enzyme YgiQ (UPF0313 family)
MARNTAQANKDRLVAERGTIRKIGGGALRIVLVYPNRYEVGMSNLGFQTVYRLFNRLPEVACERAFLPDDAADAPLAMESGRPLTGFDIIAFSVSFENDYSGLLALLDGSGLPLPAERRDHHHPLIVAGGVACMLNPEPLAPFVDCFLIGEAEAMLEPFIAALTGFGFPGPHDRAALLHDLMRQTPGAYVPRFYRPHHHPDGTLAAVEPLQGAPPTVRRTYVADLSGTTATSTVLTPHTTFESTYLIEVGRGCPNGCRFCSAGFVYRPPRFRPIDLLRDCVAEGLQATDRIGLVGAAVSDLPGIKELCGHSLPQNARVSFSSLRADALDDDFIAVLKQSNVKTATIAPDAGSDRLRRVINKGLTEADILRAAELLVDNGIPNLKLYYMVGLPTETMDDVEAIVRLCKRVKHVFLRSSRTQKRIGDITVSLSCFVPKPLTPFQWAPMDAARRLKVKIKRIKSELNKVPNVRVHADVPRWAYVQALLSRGDRRVADMLELAHRNGGNWARTLKESILNADFYVVRPRGADETFPWDFIDHGIKKSFLADEYRRALQGRTTPPCPMKPCPDCGMCRTATCG